MTPKRIRAGAIAIRDGKLLLIHRKKQGKEYFVIPGGGVDEGESREDACVRELQEETSLHAEIDAFAFTMEQEQDIQHYFLMKNILGEAKLTEDSVEALASSEENIYTPLWIEGKDLAQCNILPIEAKEWIMMYYRSKQLENFAQQILQEIRHGNNVYVIGASNSGKTYFATQILLPMLQEMYTEAAYYSTCSHLPIHTIAPAIIDEVEIMEDYQFLQSLHPEEYPFYSQEYLQKVSKWDTELKHIQTPSIALITRNDPESQIYLTKTIQTCSWNNYPVQILRFPNL